MNTGLLKVKNDANYLKFESTIERKHNLHKRTGLTKEQEIKLDLDRRRRDQHFVAYRRYESDYETHTVKKSKI